jgi:hypothetical protein
LAVRKTRNFDWHKLHIGVNADSDELVAFDPTDKEIDDAFHVGPLLEQLTDAPTSFMAYDRAHVLDAVLARNPAIRFIVPPCKGESRSGDRPLQVLDWGPIAFT